MECRNIFNLKKFIIFYYPTVTKIRELVIAQLFFCYTVVEPTIIYEDQ